MAQRTITTLLFLGALATAASAQDTWVTMTNTGAPAGRVTHTMSWTGREVIVWGGNDLSPMNTGGRYDPVTDSWTATTTTGAPGARRNHLAKWTGRELLVWGGDDMVSVDFNTGGRYDPATDSWTPMTTTGALSGRHAEGVWTGRELIVWGGTLGFASVFYNDGARYDPVSDTWTAMSGVGAPGVRYVDMAWSGRHLVVWGGAYTGGSLRGDGARYDPVSDTWAAITSTGAPAAAHPNAVHWTGKDVIFYRRVTPNAVAARYDPNADSWSSMSTVGQPAELDYHSTVWTGAELIVWGGEATNLNTGARYNPVTNAWVALPTAGAPSARTGASGVWTGREAIFWGGNISGALQSNGARYRPPATPADQWAPMSLTGVPTERQLPMAIWTGKHLVIWGGNGDLSAYYANGGRYDPLLDSWSAVNTSGELSPRVRHCGVWTGREILIWGGHDNSVRFNNGGRYDPVLDSWGTITTTGALSARSRPAHVWTGRELLVWGGEDASEFNDGARYDPRSDTWTAMSAVAAPSARVAMTSIWTGKELLIWGGGAGGTSLSTGARYDPRSDTWATMTMTNAPSARYEFPFVWTGREMVVWGGGSAGPAYFDTGARYDPQTDVWTTMSTSGAPTGRTDLPGVWTGREAIFWGGYDTGFGAHADGAKYDPFADTWTAITGTGAPGVRYSHPSVWTGREMLVWGGHTGPITVKTGGRYGADGTAPIAGAVNDGLAADIDSQASLTAISANWSGFSDPDSGIASYEWAIGTTPGGTNIQAYTSVGLATTATNSSLALNGGLHYVSVRATNGFGLTVIATSDGVQVPGPAFVSQAFFGGAGDQTGRGVALGAGAVYIAGFTDPANADGFVAAYSLPPLAAPTWSHLWPVVAGQDHFLGIATSSEGVYLTGASYSQTSDLSGGKEPKGITVKYPLAGSTPTWQFQTPAAPGAYAYGGQENLAASVTAVEGPSVYLYAAGTSQSNGGAGGRPFMCKIDSAGANVWTAQDNLSTAFGEAYGITVLNGNIYITGVKTDEGPPHPFIRKFDAAGTLLWERTGSGQFAYNGQFMSIRAFGGALYAVGQRVSGVGGSNDFVIEKWDESGTRLWTRQFDRSSGTDDLYGCVGLGTRLYAVGSTTSATAGLTDVIILEIDLSNGDLLSSTLWGGALDEHGRAVEAVGADLYVTGFSKSFTVGGNGAGQSDAFLLRYTVDSTAPVAGAVNDGLAADVDTQVSSTTISANWSGFSDPDSGIASYEWAIGTTPGGTNIQAYTNVALATTATNSSLTLNGGLHYVSVRATNGVGLTVIATSDGVTVPGPAFASQAFFGGAGDQFGRALAYGSGGLYVAGEAGADADGIVARYSVPPGASPTWSHTWPVAAGGDAFYGVGVSSEGVYVAGTSYSQTSDPAGGKENKGISLKYPLAGTTPTWQFQTPAAPAFAYGGTEVIRAATVVEGPPVYLYAVGVGESGGGVYRPFISKVDSAGSILWTVTVPGAGNFGDAVGVTHLNGNIYVAGYTNDEGPYHPFIRKYDPAGTLLWERKGSAYYAFSGYFRSIRAFGGAIYAVGHRLGGVGGSTDFLIEKWDESGAQLWTRQFDRSSGTEDLLACVGLGTRLYAVGHTNSGTAGLMDAIILELDPANGDLLSSTLWGGTLDDQAQGADTDGVDLYVTGWSKSYTVGGNGAGQSDAILLRYTTLDSTAPVAGTVNDGLAADVDTQVSTTTISANWTGFSDPGSGIASYEWAIGTTPGGTNIQAYTNVALATTATNSSLTLNGGLHYVSVRATNGVGLTVIATSDGVTVPGPAFASQTFFGGAGDQTGNGVVLGPGSVYVAGSSGTDPDGFVAAYAVPPLAAPTWSHLWPAVAGNDSFSSAALSSEGLYLGGGSYSQTSDLSGGKEIKGITAKYPLAGSTPAWAVQTPGAPGAFAYGGTEYVYGIATAVEGPSVYAYSAGFAESGGIGGRPYLSKVDSSGGIVWTVTDVATLTHGVAFGVMVLNGNIYVGGFTNDEGPSRPFIKKYAPDNTLLWERKGAAYFAYNGYIRGIRAFGGAIYVVGQRFTGVGGSNDFVIEKWNEAGTQLWTRQFDRSSGSDDLTGGVGLGTRFYAVGHTDSGTAGLTDAIILEIDPANGDLLGSTLWGGTLDDQATGADTDGVDLYVTGWSKSYTVGGNGVGQSDAILLRYTTLDGSAPVAGTVNDGLGADIDAQASTTTISANWSGFSDPGSGIASYAWAIGTTPGGTNIQAYTNVALATTATNSSLSLGLGSYYVTVRATNGVGMTVTATSDGVSVLAPPTWTPLTSLATGREYHTATLLRDGRVLVAGGWSGGSPLATCEIFNPATGTWSATGSLINARRYHGATLLPNGKVLITGGNDNNSVATCELYDPVAGTWSATGSLAAPRQGIRVALMLDGRVLTCGGRDPSGALELATAEIYDVAAGTWSAANPMTIAHDEATLTRLSDGRFLVAGGGTTGGGPTAVCEIYDPGANTWTATGSLATARVSHGGVLLADGRVLVGGGGNGSSVPSAEIFNPGAGTWSLAGTLPGTARYGFSTTLLPDGRVLFGPGIGDSGATADCDLYDPATGLFSAAPAASTGGWGYSSVLLPSGKVLFTGATQGGPSLAAVQLYDPSPGRWTAGTALSIARNFHSSTPLPDGRLLIAGGYTGATTATCEIYNPAAGTTTATGPLNTARYGHSAIVLPDGRILVAGGQNPGALASCEIYDPGAGTWSVTGALGSARWGASLSFLRNGLILVAGGNNGGRMASCELYDPLLGTWSATGSLGTARDGLSSVVLFDGKVLALNGQPMDTACELYDPVLGTWSLTGSLAQGRYGGGVALLPDGRVLAAGGDPNGGTPTASCEIFNPGTGTWSATGSLNLARWQVPGLVSLPGGRVVIIGGGLAGGLFTGSTELWDPATGVWRNAPPLSTPRMSNATVNLTSDGRILVAGGWNGAPLASCEYFDFGAPASSKPSITTVNGSGAFPVTVTAGSTLTLTGLRFRGISESSGGRSGSPADVPQVWLVGPHRGGSSWGDGAGSAPMTLLTVSAWQSGTSLSVALPPSAQAPAGQYQLYVQANGILGTSRTISINPDLTAPVAPNPWVELAGSGSGGGVSNTAGTSGDAGNLLGPALALDASGNPVIAWQDSTSGNWEIYLKRWNGSAWVELAGSGSAGGLSNTGTTSTSPVLALDSAGNPVVAWVESAGGNYEIYLRRWNGSAWVQLGGSASGGGVSSTTGASFVPSLAIDSADNPVVVWSDDFSGDTEIYLRRWNGLAWVEVGGSASGRGISSVPGTSRFPSLALDASDNPNVAWAENIGAGMQGIYFRRWTGSAWEELGGSWNSGGVNWNVNTGAGATTRRSLALDSSGRPYIAWNEGNVYLRYWNGAAWVGIGGSDTGFGVGTFQGYPALALDATGKPVLAYGYWNASNAYLRRWNGSAWVELAGSDTGGGISQSASQSAIPTMALDASGNPAVAWIDFRSGNAEIYFRRYDPTAAVQDGAGADIDVQVSTTTVQANWAGFFDPQSGITGYEWAIGTTPGGTDIQGFTSVGLATSGINSSLSLSGSGTYYITIRATNGAGLQIIQVSDGVIPSGPTAGTVNDGSGVDVNFQTSLTTISANWSGFSDPSGISSYEWAIGTSPFATNTQSFIGVGLSTSAVNSSLSLTQGGRYYVTVRATSVATRQVLATSNGVTVDTTPPDSWQWVELAGSGSGGGVSNNTGMSSDPYNLQGSALQLDAAGYPVIAWSDNTSGNDEIYLRRWNGLAWVELGGSATGGGLSNNAGVSRAPSLTLDGSGNPVVAWHDSTSGNYEIYLRRWNGTAWVDWGGSGSGGGVSANAGSSESPSLVLDSAGNPVVAWRDISSGDYEIYLRRWNGAAWVEVGGSATGGGVSATPTRYSYVPSLALNASDNPSIAWNDNYAIYFRRWNGSIWEELGGSGSTTGVNVGVNGGTGTTTPQTLVLDASGNPYIAWNWQYSYIRYWNGASWTGLGGSDSGTGISSTPGSPSMVLDNSGYPVVAIAGSGSTFSNVHLRRWNGSSWIQQAGSDSKGGISRSVLRLAHCPAVRVNAAGEASVAWSDNTSGTREVYFRRYDPGSVVRDGLGSDVDSQSSTTTISANWERFHDLEIGGWAYAGGVVGYEWCIGTTPGGTQLQGFVSVGLATSATNSSLALSSGQTYYVTVRASNGAGLTTSASSDGVLVVSSMVASSGSLGSSRYAHSATTLRDGRVLFAGGKPNGGSQIGSAEIFDPVTGVFSATGALGAARNSHTATLLPDGRVLVAGGYYNGSAVTTTCEVYDPATAIWSATGAMSGARKDHSATLLRNGLVLVVGGTPVDSGASVLTPCELFNPATNTWSGTGALTAGRMQHTVALMADGRVLVAGGAIDASGSPALASCEIYDPGTGLWSGTGSLTRARHSHQLVEVVSGDILAVGGLNPGSGTPTICERFNGTTWSDTGALATGRYRHSATVLPNLNVLVVGGSTAVPSYLSSTEIYDAGAGTWSAGPALSGPRTAQTATLLMTGQVLLAGGSADGGTTSLALTERASIDTSLWSATGSLATARMEGIALPLPDGRILAAGGRSGPATFLASSEIFDGLTTWSATGSMAQARAYAGSVVLADGRVLVAGGATTGGTQILTCEIFDPGTGLWSPTGSLSTLRNNASLVRLRDGRVLAVGGDSGGGPAPTCEIFNPGTGTWSATGSLTLPRSKAGATLLHDGSVLVSGGAAGGSSLSSCERYTPGTGLWSATGSIPGDRHSHSATLLADGRVLVAGGYSSVSGFTVATTAIYDPGAGTWGAAGSMSVARRHHGALLIPGGRVAVLGGWNGSVSLASCEVYDPAGGWEVMAPLAVPRYLSQALLTRFGRLMVVGGGDGTTALTSCEVLVPMATVDGARPNITTINGSAALPVSVPAGGTLTLAGLRFRGSHENGGGGTGSSSPNIPVVELEEVSSTGSQGSEPSQGGGRRWRLLASGWAGATALTAPLPPMLETPAGHYTVRVIANGMPSHARTIQIVTDSTAPVAGAVNDGAGVDIDWQTSTTSLSANWSGFSDPESGIASYQVRVGTTPGASDVVAPVGVGLVTSWTSGALTLTAGQVYYVTVTATNGAGLTTAVTSDGVKAGNWIELAGSGSGSGVTPMRPGGVAIDSLGNPIIVASMGEAYLWRWNGSAWVGIGGSNTGVGISNSGGQTWMGMSVAVDPSGNPVVVWEDQSTGNFEVYLRRWNGSAWVELGGSATAGGISNAAGSSVDPKVVVDASGNPVVAWHDNASGNYEIYLKRWNGSAWVALAGSDTGGGISNTGVSPSQYCSLALDAAGNPTVAWSAWGESTPYLKRWNGSAWVELGGSATGNGIASAPSGGLRVSLALDGAGDPVVSWNQSNEIYLKRWNGSAWIEIGGSATGGGISNTAGVSGKPSLALDGAGNPGVAWEDDTDGSLQIYFRKWNGSAWIEIDGSASNGGVSRTPGSQVPHLVMSLSGVPSIIWWVPSWVGYFRTLSVADATGPVAGTVNDGAAADIDFQTSTTSVVANWSGFTDPETGITGFTVRLGTTPGGAEVVGPTPVGLVSTHTFSGLTLTQGQIYYVTVVATNGAALTTSVTSDGVTVDTTAPVAGTLDDGLGADVDFQSSLTTMSANWASCTDPESAVTYEWAIGTAPGLSNVRAFTSVGAALNGTASGLSLSDLTAYFVTVRATNGAGLQTTFSSDGVTTDITPPTAGSVNDGPAADLAFQLQASSVSANWSGFADATSGIASYEWAIGTAPLGTQVQGYTPVGAATSATAGGLGLTNGTTYYVTVRATNGSGLTVTASSNGVTVDTTSVFPIIGSTAANASTVFGELADRVHLATGDANNDGVVDLLVTKGLAGGSGRMALFQRPVDTLDNGVLVYTAPGGTEALLSPSIGNLEGSGLNWILHGRQGPGGGDLEASRLAGTARVQARTVKSTGAPGLLVGGVADLDGSGVPEIYGLFQSGNVLLNRYDFAGAAYGETALLNTGAAQFVPVRPVPFTGTTMAYARTFTTVHQVTLGGTSTLLYTAPGSTITALASGNIDYQAGTDLVIVVDDGLGMPLTLISGGTLTASPIASPGVRIRALACADLNGDGRDEVYAGADNGDVYQFTAAGGWRLLETMIGVVWHDAARTRWTGATADELVLAGLDAGNLTIRTLGSNPTPPTFSFVTNNEAPARVNFTAQYTGAALYQWDFNYNGLEFQPDYVSPVSGNCSFTYSLPGTYTARLQVTFADGTTVIFEVQVNVVPSPSAPVLSLAPDFLTGTIPFTVQFTATISATNGQIEALQWDFDGDGSVDRVTALNVVNQTASRTELFTYGTAGPYTCRVIATDTAGIAGSAEVSVQALPVPLPPTVTPATPSLSLTDVGQSVTFFATAGNPRAGSNWRFEWDFDGDGDDDFSEVVAPTGANTVGTTAYTYPAPGNFYVRVRAIDDGGTPDDPTDDLAAVDRTTIVTAEIPQSGLKVWWVQPLPGATVSGSAVALHSNTAPANETAKVEFFHGPTATGPWTKIGEKVPPPYSFFGITWDTTTLAPGPYFIRVMATPLTGAGLPEDVIQITVAAPGTMPELEQTPDQVSTPVDPNMDNTVNLGDDTQLTLEEESVEAPPGSTPVVTVERVPEDPKPGTSHAQGVILGGSYYRRMGLSVGTLRKPGELVMYYRDANGDGIEDETKIPAQDLKGYRYDEVDGKWEELLDVTVDPVERRVISRTPGFSFFALGGRTSVTPDAGEQPKSCLGQTTIPGGAALWPAVLAALAALAGLRRRRN